MASRTAENLAADLLQRAQAAGVRYIDLQFTDVMGAVKTVTIPAEDLPDTIEHGTWFDGSSVESVARTAESDMYLVPDLETFRVLPWAGTPPIARIICWAHTPDGEPYPGDPRGALRRAVEQARAMGFDYRCGPEVEFFLLRRDDGGTVGPLQNDRAGYFDFSTDQSVTVRHAMVSAAGAGHRGQHGAPRGRRRPARDRLQRRARAQVGRRRGHLPLHAQGGGPAGRTSGQLHAETVCDRTGQQLPYSRQPLARGKESFMGFPQENRFTAFPAVPWGANEVLTRALLFFRPHHQRLQALPIRQLGPHQTGLVAR